MEHNNHPLEFQKVPLEHNIPAEYPEYIPMPKKKKKGINPMLMYVFAGFLVLYMMFGYLFPTEGDGWNPDIFIPDSPQQIPQLESIEVFEHFEETLELAAESFMDDDYVGAAVTICDKIYADYLSYNAANLDGTAMVFKQNTFTQFADQDLTGDKGAYLWIAENTTYYWDDKEMTYFPESNLSVWLIRVTGTTAGNPDLKILQVSMPTNNLIYSYVNASCSYMETTLDATNCAENAFLQRFYLYLDEYDTDEALVRDGYVVGSNERIEGPLNYLKFTGQVTYRSQHIALSDSKTHLEQAEEYADYGWYYMLDDEGKLDLTAKEYEDLTALDESSDAFTKKWNAAMEDPNIYGIYYSSGGLEEVQMKNISNDDGAWTHTAYSYAWEDECFPIDDILTPWLTIRSYI